MIKLKEVCNDFRRVISDSLEFLGCSQQGINEYEINLPIKIDFHYGFTFYIDFTSGGVKISAVIEKTGSVEYFKEIFDVDYVIEEGEENFLISRELNESSEINAEELSCALISMKKNATLFLK